MENILPQHLQEVIFASSDSKVSKQISRLVRLGTLRKIAPRIYTPNFTDSSETIVRRNLFSILGHLYPGALLSHRSALEFKPTTAGHIFITYTYTKNISLPGIMLRFVEGHPAVEGDNRLTGELFAAQLERALLENLLPSRQTGALSKTLPVSEIEAKLEAIVRVKGESGLNELRDRAKTIADNLHMQAAFARLNLLIGALLSTKPSKILTSPLAAARAFGYPFDPARLSLFEELFVTLKQQEFIYKPDRNTSYQSFLHFAFFESYFSNYIEGTEFELTDARQIIEMNLPMPSRSEDSHDILGTYNLVSNHTEMSSVPKDYELLLNMLLYRHRMLLHAREAKKPGQFKEVNNRAGSTFFVDHTLVKGTLIKGFDYYNALTHPFARAVFMMFLVSEVHPFLDGNGRIARVMMNAELVREGQSKIIIPTVYRDDYLGALKKLTRQRDAITYIRMMQRAWEFSATIVGESMEDMQDKLTASQAFKAHDEAKLIILL